MSARSLIITMTACLLVTFFISFYTARLFYRERPVAKILPVVVDIDALIDKRCEQYEECD